MPTPSFGSLNQDATNEQIIDYIYKLEKELNYLLLSLDTINVNRLDAKVIKTGILDANLVTVRSDLTTGYVQIDSSGIRANNGTINTFEINSSGNAYFRGDITSDATITGALIQTATTGRRIVLSGSSLQSLNGTSKEGFTLDGTDGFLKLYTSNIETGYIGKDTVLYEKLLISHNYLLLSGLNAISLSTGTLSLGDVGSSITMEGTVGFNDTVTGLTVSTNGTHNHGIPNGTVLSTPTGTVTFLESGSHIHTVT